MTGSGSCRCADKNPNQHHNCGLVMHGFIKMSQENVEKVLDSVIVHDSI